ncbi:MAG: hypothetical protein U1F83_20735 [Verrucomicrobiota bacterium]
MKTRINLTMIGLACFFLTGCQTPEERAMSQMQRQMRQQALLMEQMQKNLDEMAKSLEKLDR